MDRLRALLHLFRHKWIYSEPVRWDATIRVCTVCKRIQTLDGGWSDLITFEDAVRMFGHKMDKGKFDSAMRRLRVRAAALLAAHEVSGEYATKTK